MRDPGTGGEVPPAVAELERELAADPENAEIRRRLAAALEAFAVEARSLTRDEVRVITSGRQRQACWYAATRMLRVAPEDPRLVAMAGDLLAEIEAGGRWVWRKPGVAGTLATVLSILGLLAVVLGALAESVVLVVVAAVFSSVALAGVVLYYRRERWRVEAERALPVVWQPGL
ncbi:hypothetical protein [Amycolatopsis cihanbeyliensis]|uniref:Uncharacterized protein n=1 Tax=Amycolatopsis cihanbeyliensis TaxID=1128664 RepID=A0A542DQJ8_AMYCI|nr:hypothetical protein [Amycolatopsis cihanbeyliensis]TQJ05382.1 hypothetical protein FB471_5211 [Amycolatopsis cihanbeyliensis]